jgi:hypothetical protein
MSLGSVGLPAGSLSFLPWLKPRGFLKGVSVNRYQQPYEERSLAVYHKKDWISDPDAPLVEEMHWTIPAGLVPEDGTRKDWSLKVQIAPREGVGMRINYPLKVMWLWPGSAAGELKGSQT